MDRFRGLELNKHIRSGTREFFIITILSCAIVLAITYPQGVLPNSSYGQLPYVPNQQRERSTNQVINPTLEYSAINQSKYGYNSSELSIRVESNGNGNYASNNSMNNKVVMITFGDGWKSQFTNAKPILDRYGFKASFYIPCNFLGLSDHMTWQEIASLQKDSMDLESKGMNDIILTNVSAGKLDFEIGRSKQCLAAHGINNATVFATPHGKGSDNVTVIDSIAKYYDFAINGFSNLMFLHCDKYKKYSSQMDCRTFDNNGKLTYANRYVIREWSHNAQDTDYLHNDSKIFPEFIKEINSQILYNKDATTINALVILAYHKIDNEKTHLVLT